MTIGERIKALRKGRHWTQEEFAGRLGVHVKTVVRWESGGRVPTLGKLKNLAEVLGSTVKYLVSGEEERETPTAPPQTPQSQRVEDEEGEKVPMTFWGDVVEKARTAVQSGDRVELSAVRVLLELALKTVEDGCIMRGVDARDVAYRRWGGNVIEEGGDEGEKNRIKNRGREDDTPV